MKKLIRGIIDFRKKALPVRREIFAKLALGQSPDVLFITCSDSRIAPNWFASMDPGDLFVVRNVGNLVPACSHEHSFESDPSVLAALEFAIVHLKVKDIVICGHSECGAMKAIQNYDSIKENNLKSWLKWGNSVHEYPRETLHLDPDLSSHNQLSQINVLQQIDHIKTHPIAHQLLQQNKLRIHGWWFDIAQGSIWSFDESSRKYRLIDEEYGEELLRRL